MWNCCLFICFSLYRATFLPALWVEGLLDYGNVLDTNQSLKYIFLVTVCQVFDIRFTHRFKQLKTDSVLIIVVLRFCQGSIEILEMVSVRICLDCYYLFRMIGVKVPLISTELGGTIDRTSSSGGRRFSYFGVFVICAKKYVVPQY